MKQIVIIVIFIFNTVIIYGQILNIENKRSEVEANGWRGNVDFSIKYTENTKAIFEFLNKTHITYKKDTVTYLFISDFNMIKNNNEDLINKGVIHIRRIQEIKKYENLKSEFFGQLQFNGLQKIKQRFLIGSGARLKVLGNDTINLNFSLGGMYEYEETTIETFHHALRLTSYVSFNWNLKEKWKLRLINYYQPRVNNFSNYRLSSETSLSYKVSKEFSIVGTYELSYDSDPVVEVPNKMFSTYLLFRYKF